MSEVTEITKAEIERYKDMFTSKIGHYAVQFGTKEENGKIVDNLEIYKGDSGIDANWSGSVILEKDYYVKWDFSILNGAHIEANMRLNDENKDLVSKIYNFYEIWRDGLSKYLVSSPEDTSQSLPPDSGEEIISGGPAETSPEGEQMPISESRTTKGRQKTINENSQRMKRLAGL